MGQHCEEGHSESLSDVPEVQGRPREQQQEDLIELSQGSEKASCQDTASGQRVRDACS